MQDGVNALYHRTPNIGIAPGSVGTFSLFAELSMCWIIDRKCLSLSWKRMSSEVAASAENNL